MTCHITFEPIGKRVSCQKDAIIFEVARDAGIGLDSFCGGKGTCGKCIVRILSGKVSPLTKKEEELLSKEDIAGGYRLACLTRVYQSARIEIPLKSLLVSQRLQLSGRMRDVGVDPVVVTYSVNLSPPSLTDVKSDETRLIDHLAGINRPAEIDLSVQRQLPICLRENKWQIKTGMRSKEVLWIGQEKDELYGIAVDLGTTKVAAYLIELQTGKTVASIGSLNRQVAYGEDIITRIGYAIDNGGEKLSQVITDNINQLIHQMCIDKNVSKDNIVEAVIVGNTAMHHLFLGLPVRQLGLAPYVPAVCHPMNIKAREIGLQIASGGYVHLLPNIAGFVGADHVAMLLATEIYSADKKILGLDIGTNTEISLAVGGKLVSCSCASGPAFEGAHIKDGMRATGGAIERVRIDGSSVDIRTIDNEPPIGLCGSGILDAIAQLLEASVINQLGRFKDHPRVRKSENGKEFILVPEAESGSGRDITITNKDISEIQLAKGAINAGMNALLDKANICWEEIDEIIIAGAFGSYIDVASAISIGLLPPLPRERFLQVGNAAGAGAKLALTSMEQRKLAVEIASKVEYVELTSYSNYPKMFAKAIRLTRW